MTVSCKYGLQLTNMSSFLREFGQFCPNCSDIKNGPIHHFLSSCGVCFCSSFPADRGDRDLKTNFFPDFLSGFYGKYGPGFNFS